MRGGVKFKLYTEKFNIKKSNVQYQADIFLLQLKEDCN